MKKRVLKLILVGAITVAPLSSGAATPAAGLTVALKGSYSFRFSGQDYATFSAGTTNQITGVGVFKANGKGAITAGSLSYNDGGDLCPGSITGGTYSILSDGEGDLNLSFTPNTGVTTCRLSLVFEFNIAVADLVKGVAQTVELGSNFFTLPSGTSVSTVPVSGVARLQ